MSDHPSLEDLLIARPRAFVFRQVLVTAQAFARVEASSGLVLLAAAVAAMVWANSPWSDSYFSFWHTHVAFEAPIVSIDLDLREWVNEGLMTVFFFLMGLEIKRELVNGELSSRRRALLPATAALGGMVVPALIYTAFNLGGEGGHGWGVPMATDIAFALGVLSLLSRRVPFSVRIFLLALAIADDIGAILVIALFYTSGIDAVALGAAAAALGVVFVLNRAGVRSVEAYVAVGAVMWVAMLESGVHATITGVTLGLLAPASQFYKPSTFADTVEDLAHRFRLAHETGNISVQESILDQMQDLIHGTESPLERLERSLVRWVTFLIVPVFALANAGVLITGDVVSGALSSPVTQGVALGLVLGKPAGIVLFTWLAVKLGLCDLPGGASWSHVVGIGLLGGVGFTVSLLITNLAFGSALLADEAKLGVLCASVVAGLAGFLFLRATSQAPRRTQPVRQHVSVV